MTTLAKNRLTMAARTGLALSGLLLSGCVTVPAEPRPVRWLPSERHTPVVTPQIVQGPAREALERMPADPVELPPAAPRQTHLPPSSAPQADDAPPRRSRPSTPRRTDTPRPTPPAVRPSPTALPTTIRDVCALGEHYGALDPDGATGRICREWHRKGWPGS
ncbi:hypothetical protein ACFQ61_26575 [Streptomyces sp. NPDC056500]|uniref:hypothetical protein n=1 Tax=Streptomyces sp. NPDC056500 TaxID=3345840 RepID=UPI0036B71B27